MKCTTKNTINLSLSEKTIASIFCIDFSVSNNKDVIIKEMLDQIKQNPNFILGEFKNEEKLAESLKRKVFGETEVSALKSISTSIDEISKILDETLLVSFNKLHTRDDIDVYVLPLCNKKASEDLDGVNGFTVEGRNVLYLLIDITHPNWRKSLQETVPHEYAHMFYTAKFSWNSILDGIVNEGLAEHFREYVIGGDQAPWSVALKKDEAIKILNELPESRLNELIDDSNVDLYISYFFGTKNLPEWYGYSLGYWLIDEVMNRGKVDLIELFKKSPKEILGLFKS